MNGSKSFFDTNILLYLLSEDRAKADCAEALFAAGGVISVQVLNEFAAVASRKRAMSWPEIREILSTVRMICTITPISVETHERGLFLAERYGFSLYDSLIVAAASLAECSILYSEDMQDGQIIDRLKIQNPFTGI
jgi:predicted nucleic acid-binding protein